MRPFGKPFAKPPGNLSARKMAEAIAMRIDTYFGFFAEAFFKAIQGSLTQQTITAISYEGLEVGTTNSLKLRWSDVDTVILPERVIEEDIPFVLALTAKDVQVLSELAQRGISLQRLMEQAVSTAMEPFNFISKRRNRLASLQFSHNVTGLTAAHLRGEVSYTMATGRYRLRSRSEFALRLLVTPKGRDRIEGRVTEGNTQRALFSIIEGAYVCGPQWDPPPPPPEAEAPTGLSERLGAAWMQSFLALNDGAIAARVFGQPVGFQSALVAARDLDALASEQAPVTVVRLIANDKKELEALVVLRQDQERELLRLSKSAEPRFLGELFRVLFGEAAALWSRLLGQDVQWKAIAVARIPPESIDAVTKRLEGGGVALNVKARLDEGHIEWHAALPPHTWHWMMRLTAQAMNQPVGASPDRDQIFQASGWGAGTIPWKVVFPFFGDRDLQMLIRQLERVRLTEADLAAIGKALTHGGRDRWLEAMPVNLRERVHEYKVAPGEGPRRQIAITGHLIELNRANRLPEGKLVPWLQVYSEFQWHRRQHLMTQQLPLRHFVYGMDRASLSRLLYDITNEELTEMLCPAEFPVLDQVRRAISPGFALRLLDDVSVKRPRTSAFQAQTATLGVYRRALAGQTQGRYLIRQTVSKRLRELIRWLDEPR